MPRQKQVRRTMGLKSKYGYVGQETIEKQTDYYSIDQQRGFIRDELEQNKTYLELAIKEQMSVGDVVAKLKSDAKVHTTNKPFNNQLVGKVGISAGDKLKVFPGTPASLKKHWEGEQGWQLLADYYTKLSQLQIVYAVPGKKPLVRMKNLLNKSDLLLRNWKKSKKI